MDRSKYTVGWICALREEFVAARAFLDELHPSLEEVPNDPNNYVLGKMSGHNIVMTCFPLGGYGTASAAAVAINMVRSFPNVGVGLTVGIGGGAPSKRHDIRLGDVVVGTPMKDHPGVIEYDFGKSIQTMGFVRSGALNRPPNILQRAVESLRASHELEGHTLMNDIEEVLQTKPKLRRAFGRPNIDDQLYKSTFVHSTSSNDCQSCGSDPSHVEQRDPRDEDNGPAIFYGLIASGNQIMKDALIRDKFAMERDVLCFDIGAAGIINGFPCLVIRGIYDYSDSHKNKKWLGYAAMTAAAYSKALLHHLIDLTTHGTESESLTIMRPIVGQQQRNDAHGIHGTIDQTLSMESIAKTSWEGNVMSFDHFIFNVVQIGETNINQTDEFSKSEAPHSMVIDETAQITYNLPPFSDSGYGTVNSRDSTSMNTKIPHANYLGATPDLQEPFDPAIDGLDDTQTVYSDSTEFSETRYNSYVAALADALFEQLTLKTLDNQTAQRMSNVLPRLLKTFALQLGYEAPSQMHRDVMFFIHKNREDITESFKLNCIEMVDSGSEHQSKDIMDVPSTEIMDRWRTAPEEWESNGPPEADPVDHNDQVEVSSSHGSIEELDQEREFDQGKIPALEEYKKLIFGDPGFTWLLDRLRRELLLTKPKQDIMESLREKISRALPVTRYISKKNSSQGNKISYLTDWDPLAFFHAQCYDDLRTFAFSDVITLTGSSLDAQALRCEEYLAQTWPQTGPHTLSLIQKLMFTKNSSKAKCNVLSGLTLEASIEDSKLVVEAYGVPNLVVEIGEQLAWLGATLQSSPYTTGIVYCTPFIDNISSANCDNSDSRGPVLALQCRIKFRFEKCEKTFASSNGQCWHDMFLRPVIAQGFPIRTRSETATGLEMPLNMMVALLRTPFINTFRSKVFIKGFSAMLVPTKRTDDVLIWHLLHSKYPNDRISYLDCNIEHANINMAELESIRHVVGWCSEAVIIAGTLESMYSIKNSGLPVPRSDVTLEKFQITAGHIVTGTAKFKLGDNEKPTHISRFGYFNKMQWISSKYFIMWDEADHRGWLVDGATALLHLLRASLEHSKRIFGSAFLLDSTSLTDPTSLADTWTQMPPNTAMNVLINQTNRDLNLYVDKNEVYDEEISYGLTTHKILKKKTKYYQLQDKIEHIYNTMEKLVDEQADMEQQNGINVKPRPRRRLEGWDFKDIAADGDPFYRRVCTLQTMGKGWVDFARGIHAVALFGRGFGELIRPKSTAAPACSRWSLLPAKRFYLAAHMVTLQKIMEQNGNSTSDPRQLCDNVLWHIDEDIFQECPCVKRGRVDHHDPVQSLFPTKFRIQSKKKSLQALGTGGAVIFGHSTNLHWHWPDSGNPVDGYPPNNEDMADPLEDSGLGSSIPSSSNANDYESNDALFLAYHPILPGQTPNIPPTNAAVVSIEAEQSVGITKTPKAGPERRPLKGFLSWLRKGKRRES